MPRNSIPSPFSQQDLDQLQAVLQDLGCGNFSDTYKNAQQELSSALIAGHCSVITEACPTYSAAGTNAILPIKSASSSSSSSSSSRVVGIGAELTPTNLPKTEDEGEPEELGYRFPQQASPYATAQEVQELRASFEYARSIGRELNCFVTVNLQSHDCWGKTERELRRSLFGSFSDLFRNHGLGDVHAVYVFENDAAGGRGLHLHWLGHVPKERYETFVDAFHSIFAKRYGRKLRALRDRRSGSLNALGLMPQARASLPEIYDALKQLRASKLTTIPARTQEDLARREQVIASHALPFSVSTNCTQAPLSEQASDAKLRYMAKSIDPETDTTHQGKPTTIAEISRDALAMFGNNHGVLLQTQSRRRFRSGNIGSTDNINRKAQMANGFTPSLTSLGDFLEPHAARLSRLAAFQRAHAARFYSPASAPPIGPSVMKPHADVKPLLALLTQLLPRDATQPDDQQPADNQSLIAGLITIRNRREYRSHQMQTPDAEMEPAVTRTI